MLLKSFQGISKNYTLQSDASFADIEILFPLFVHDRVCVCGLVSCGSFELDNH